MQGTKEKKTTEFTSESNARKTTMGERLQVQREITVYVKFYTQQKDLS